MSPVLPPDRVNSKPVSTTRSSRTRSAVCEATSVPSTPVAVDPTGKSYASGGEDGYVRVHHFDKGYFDFFYEVERERNNRMQ
ncbi:translation initiation factor eIF3 subunit [Metarhizium acridum]|nr:translation initiation factor eIF3 subunit [Metarhizium acridum]